MISLTQSEKAITAQVLETVFGDAFAPTQIFGIEVTELETVVIATASGLYSLGKAYFKSLVKQFKETVSAVKQSSKAKQFLASEDLTYSSQDLRDAADEALEKGDFEGAIALAENAQDTDQAEAQEPG